MLTSFFQTFTVGVHVYPWMQSETDASAHLLCDFIEDHLERMDIRGTATACVLDSKAMLWFTFSSEADAIEARVMIGKLFEEVTRVNGIQ